MKWRKDAIEYFLKIEAKQERKDDKITITVAFVSEILLLFDRISSLIVSFTYRNLQLIEIDCKPVAEKITNK